MNSDDGELAGLEGANFPGAEAALRRAAHVAHRRAEAATANTGKPLAFGTMAVPCGRSKSWWGGFLFCAGATASVLPRLHLEAVAD